MSDRSDYTWKGDTYWMTEECCPDCNNDLTSNGTIYSCAQCEWWGLIEEFSEG